MKKSNSQPADKQGSAPSPAPVGGRMSMAALKKLQASNPPQTAQPPPQSPMIQSPQAPNNPPNAQKQQKQPQAQPLSISQMSVQSAARNEDGRVVNSTPNSKAKGGKIGTPALHQSAQSSTAIQDTPFKPLKPLPFYTYPTNSPLKFEKYLKIEKNTTVGGKIVGYPIIGLNQVDATRLGLLIGDLVVLSLLIPIPQRPHEIEAQNSKFTTPHKSAKSEQIASSSCLSTEQPPSPAITSTPFKHHHPSLLTPSSLSTPSKPSTKQLNSVGSDCEHTHLVICKVQTFGAIERGFYRLDTSFKSQLPWFQPYQQFAVDKLTSSTQQNTAMAALSPKLQHNSQNAQNYPHEALSPEKCAQNMFQSLLTNVTKREEIDRAFFAEHNAYITVLRHQQLYFSHSQSQTPLSTDQTHSLPLQYPQVTISPLSSLSIAKNNKIINDDDEIAYIIKSQKDSLSMYQNPHPIRPIEETQATSSIPHQLSSTLDAALVSILSSSLPTYILANTPIASSICGVSKPYFPYSFQPNPAAVLPPLTSPSQPSPIIIYATTPQTVVNLTLGRRQPKALLPSDSHPTPSHSPSTLSPPPLPTSIASSTVTIAGLDKEMSVLRETLELPLTQPHLFSTFGLKPPKGVLLHGSPGCGKTLLAHWFSEITSAQFIPLTATNIVSRGGASYLYKLFSTLSSHESSVNITTTQQDRQYPTTPHQSPKSIPIIIFIDEIDGLCNDNTIVCALLSLLDGGHDSYANICILAATNRPNVLPAALRRPGRFDVELHITPPGIQAREEILKAKLHRQYILHNLTSIELTSIAEHLNGFVGADIDLLISEAISHSVLRAYQIQSETDMDSIEFETSFNPPLTLTDFHHALQIIRPSGLRDYNAISVTDSQVGGHEEIKQRLEEAFEWPLRHANLVHALGARKSSGILLFGPPGCAKTLLAKSICARSKRTFLCVKGPELFSKYVGDSEKAVRNVFQRARACAPCILFLDEIDSFGASRGGSGGDATDRVVSQLLVELDGIGDRGDVCILAATNRPDLVDRALLRAGRLDRSLYVGPPDEHETEQILQINLSKVACENDVFEQLPQFAAMCHGKRHTGAELAAICRDASVRALTRYILKQQHLMTEMKDNFADLSSDEFISLFSSTPSSPSPDIETIAEHTPTNRQDVKVTVHDVADAISNAAPRITETMIQFYTEYQKKHGLTNL